MISILGLSGSRLAFNSSGKERVLPLIGVRLGLLPGGMELEVSIVNNLEVTIYSILGNSQFAEILMALLYRIAIQVC